MEDKIIENNIAYVIKNIKSISGKDPGKKVLQKLVFLIEEKGVDLGCEYGLHFYGPYSSKVDTITAYLYTEGILRFNYSAYAHLMEVDEEWEVRPEVSLEQEKIMIDVLTRYKDKSPSQLELLTTTIYAYNHLEDKSRESVINGVKKIKGAKYSKEKIENMLKELSYFNKVV